MARRGLEPKPGCRLWTSRLQRQSIKSLKSRECKLGAGRALGPPPRSSQCRPCIWQDLLEPFCLVQADQSRPFGSGLWTILSVAPNQRATGDRKCDMCATEEGELVPTSAEWQNALWIAKKHIVTWVQPMVQSPILARYAAAAYRLRQKPLGMCCKSCQQWVWGHHKNPPREGAVLEPIGHVWPKLGEAAITGPQYFLEDFGAHEVEEPWGPGEAGCEPLAMTAGDKTSKTGEANQTQSSTELESQSRRLATGPTRKDWCRLSDIIVQEPADCLKVKSAQLLDWIE